MESVSGSDVRLPRVGAVGLGTGQDKSSRAGGADGAMAQGGSRGVGNWARQEFASGRSRWCDGAGAFLVPARHHIDMALRHQGCTWG